VIDTPTAQYAVDTTGSVTLLNGIATGTDFTNRIGRKVCWRSFLISGKIQPQDGGTDPNMYRIMLVYDSQPNGGLAGVTDVLTTANADSPLNLNNRDRFRVLMDKRGGIGFFSNTATQAVADRTISIIHKYKKINMETIFDGTTAAIGDIQSGSIFLLTVGSNAAGLGSNAFLHIRLRFTDA